MLIYFLSFLMFFAFLSISSLHFYWFNGGKWGLSSVIPIKNNENTNVTPPKAITLLVAIILLFIAFLYMIKYVPSLQFISSKVLVFLYWLVPTLFIIRSIGDFKYLGIFKKVKHTKFAQTDSSIIIPICLLISLTGYTLQILITFSSNI